MPNPAKMPRFSERERQVGLYLQRGLDERAISEALGVPKADISNIISRMMSETGTFDRLGLVNCMLNFGITD